MNYKKKPSITPAQIILLGYLALIMLGALLLTLPFATRDGHGACFADAIFTATSAGCVTGLIVQDTFTYWSGFGQAVILTLIQIGGLGIITFALAISMVSRKQIGLKSRWVMQESIGAPQVGGILRQTKFFLLGSLTVELTGALLLSLRFCKDFPLSKGIWYGVWHSVSAFCNAGFDLMGTKQPFSSLTGYTGDIIVNTVIDLLILIGGIGFFTWRDIADHRLRFTRYSLQSKLILLASAILLSGGFAFFAGYEFRLPGWQGLTVREKLLACLGCTISPRTAGFNTVDLNHLSEPGKLMTIILMLIGGAPSSTAGGFKLTTLAVLVVGTCSVFQRRADAVCCRRRIDPASCRNAAAIFSLYLILFLAGGTLISCLDAQPLMTALFEAASAVATVGLSLGATPTLSAASRWILIFLMYLGRVGGLTLIYAVFPGIQPGEGTLPQEKVTVG